MTTPLDDPRVIAALEEYMMELESGRRPDRRAFLARHKDIADALSECLKGMEALQEAGTSSSQGVYGARPTSDWHPGQTLGEFRIVREVGRGGMGVVYEAEQVSLGRRIALKVLPFALTLDTRQLQRFKNEARAAAQLHHQNIVPVFYVGSERGVHFYAMQYIDGQSLAEVIQGLRQLVGPESGPAGDPAPRSESIGLFASSPQERALTTAVRLDGALTTASSKEGPAFYQAAARLAAQAAEALEHAHACGLIHRDVKPANLMVDAQGHLWVTDFGLAQLQSDAGLTQTGDLLGTLRYMSPEQAVGQRGLLDHRTDIYSLGATLYELLTLQPPFDGANRQRLLHQILYEEPQPPRALRRSVPAELETIVLKCLAKAPAERYSTARELAEDLQRFLRYEPIRARRATPVQRLRKWARRHPSVVWAGVVLCMLTAAVSLGAYDQVRREQARTQAAYDQEQQRAREAEERFVLAREELDGMFKLCEEELADKPHLDNLRRRLLENFLVYYQRLIEQRRDVPEAEELAATRTRVWQILDDLAVMQGAGQHLLLKEPAVLDDLRLKPEQRERVRKLTRAMDQQGPEFIRKLARLSPEERREHFLRTARQTEADVEKVLTTAQRRRLRQIDLQRKGDRAFEEPDVTAALKLTASQKDQIRALREKALFRRLWHPEGSEGPPEGSRAEPSLVEQVVEAVLTKEQGQRWRELTGEPFQGEPFKGPPWLSHAPPDR